jgi:hypothetical protein
MKNLLKNNIKIMSKIIVYATSKDGNGYVSQVGVYENIEDIEIRAGIFTADTVITFGVDHRKDDEKGISKKELEFKASRNPRDEI